MIARHATCGVLSGPGGSTLGGVDTPTSRRAELNPARVLGLAALGSGILAAAVNADAWWFLLGVIAFGFLFAAGEG